MLGRKGVIGSSAAERVGGGVDGSGGFRELRGVRAVVFDVARCGEDFVRRRWWAQGDGGGGGGSVMGPCMISTWLAGRRTVRPWEDTPRK